jgi:hypothetical protein
MKKKILILFFIMFSIIRIHAQTIPEKANTIIITMPDSAAAREKVLKVLADRGYTASPGKTSSVISSPPKTLKNGARVGYNFQMKGKEIILTGTLPVAGQPNMNISYNGNKGTPIMNGWEEMDKIAKALGGKVKYEKK